MNKLGLDLVWFGVLLKQQAVLLHLKEMSLLQLTVQLSFFVGVMWTVNCASLRGNGYRVTPFHTSTDQ